MSIHPGNEDCESCNTSMLGIHGDSDVWGVLCAWYVLNMLLFFTFGVCGGNTDADADVNADVNGKDIGNDTGTSCLEVDNDEEEDELVAIMAFADVEFTFKESTFESFSFFFI